MKKRGKKAATDHESAVKVKPVKPADPDQHVQPTRADFEREGMGVAPKE